MIVICFVVYALKYTKLARYHEWLTIFAVTAFSASLAVIIHIEPTLESMYFVGLVQVAVFVSFLLRVSFPKAIAPMTFIIVSFIFAIQNKVQDQTFAAQPPLLITMVITCTCGIYILERYRRSEFLKARLIKSQNEQLGQMLEASQRDQERKVAALNMLLHVVKTPIHQISGFSDLVLSQLKTTQENEIANQCVDSAQYIKDASDSLNVNVSNLLAYHQLDELERTAEFETIHVKEFLEDETAIFDTDITVTTETSVDKFKCDRRAFEIAVSKIFKNATIDDAQISQLDIDVYQENATVIFRIKDDGPDMGAEAFANATMPLTEIDNYLNADGSSLSMGLRTVARVMEICNGRVEHSYENGNVYLLTFPLDPTKSSREENDTKHAA